MASGVGSLVAVEARRPFGAALMAEGSVGSFGVIRTMNVKSKFARTPGNPTSVLEERKRIPPHQLLTAIRVPLIRGCHKRGRGEFPAAASDAPHCSPNGLHDHVKDKNDE